MTLIRQLLRARTPLGPLLGLSVVLLIPSMLVATHSPAVIVGGRVDSMDFGSGTMVGSGQTRITEGVSSATPNGEAWLETLQPGTHHDGKQYWLSASVAGHLVTPDGNGGSTQFDTLVGVALSTTILDITIAPPIGPL